MIEKLTWDSDFFNKNIGQIDASQLKNADLCGYDLIYATSTKDFEIHLEKFECAFKETKVVFEKNNFSNSVPQPNVVPISEINFNIKDIYLLAFESGKYSRFLLDKNFSKSDFQKMYQVWVDNSISKQIATDVLVYTENQKILGFVTYKIDGATARIGLIAVNQETQGKGIGKKLLNHVEYIAQMHHCNGLYIPTQKQNIAACNFYSKQQYHVISETYIKHYWRY